jgi:hypothetical protein
MCRQSRASQHLAADSASPHRTDLAIPHQHAVWSGGVPFRGMSVSLTNRKVGWVKPTFRQ